MYKLREIRKECERSPHKAFGITINEEISVFFKGCFFRQEVSGTCIILTSGAKLNISEEELKDYKYEDCIIKEVRI
jgi:hypothetical protein